MWGVGGGGCLAPKCKQAGNYIRQGSWSFRVSKSNLINNHYCTSLCAIQSIVCKAKSSSLIKFMPLPSADTKRAVSMLKGPTPSWSLSLVKTCA